MPEPRIFVAVPAYDSIEPEALAGLSIATEKYVWWRQVKKGSLLGKTFNELLVDALNSRDQGWTHFAMHHADIEAPVGWLDHLVDEQIRTGADVVSAVVPIKDNRGLTTTGFMDPHTQHISRLTLKEIHQLPETFDAAAAGRPGHWLMVNTGLWVMDFTKPWVERIGAENGGEPTGFHILDKLVQRPDGRWRALVLSEDWNFSRWCAVNGLKVMATRAVPVEHYGKSKYGNTFVWGTCATDPGDEPKAKG